MSEELSNIQKLIRLKRYEHPPEGYFEDFLLEFQRRQRAEMLQRPVWQIMWERANLWLEGFRVPALAYAGIIAAAVGIAGFVIAPNTGTQHLASTGTTLNVPSSAPINPVLPASTDGKSSYVLEQRPVSYDAPFSF